MLLSVEKSRALITTIKVLACLLLLAVLVVVGMWVYWLHFTEAEEPELAGSFSEHVLPFAGHERNYALYTPKALAAKPALLLVLHGSRGTGAAVRRQSAYEFDVYAEEQGYLVVYPDGFENHWNGCRRSAGYSANTQGIDDVGFLRVLVQQLTEQYDADPSRVVVTGFSNGGHMAYRLAMEAPELIRGIAPIAASLPVTDNLGCVPQSKAVSVAIFNGTEDPVNPFEGGLVSVSGDSTRGLVQSSQQTAAYWVQLAGLDQPPVVIDHPEHDDNLDSSVREQRWDGAEQVSLFTLQGSGHVIPSYQARFPRILGGEAGDVSAASVLAGTWLARQ